MNTTPDAKSFTDKLDIQFVNETHLEQQYINIILHYATTAIRCHWLLVTSYLQFTVLHLTDAVTESDTGCCVTWRMQSSENWSG